MEEFFLPVAMIAWVEGIQFVQPRETQGYGLKQHSAPPTEPEQLTYQRTVSDAIVLDFLIDGCYFLLFHYHNCVFILLCKRS